MGKCIFRETWFDIEEFRSWLEAVPGNRYEARCKLCKRNIKLGTLGIKALQSHAKAKRHRLATKMRAQATTLFCSPPQTSSSVAGPSGLHHTTTSASDLATFDSSDASKSEVLWVLHSITNHLPYDSSSDISSLFRAMFPDSNIAKNFTCGPNKIAYIAKFGLADFIKRERTRTTTGQHETFGQIECLDPSLMFKDPEKCRIQMKSLVLTFLEAEQLTGGVPAGDAIVQQFESFLYAEARNEEFLAFQPCEERLDTFLFEKLIPLYPDAWDFCQKLLLLSDGQASAERGFSVKKEVEDEDMHEDENMQEDTTVTHRLICDYVEMHGGVTQVPLTDELMAFVGGAREKYRLFLDQERTRKERESQSQKRKLAAQSLEDLKKRKKILEEVSTCLVREADELAEKAEGEDESKMIELISKSNALRRAYKENFAAQLETLETEIDAKEDELIYM